MVGPHSDKTTLHQQTGTDQTTKTEHGELLECTQGSKSHTTFSIFDFAVPHNDERDKQCLQIHGLARREDALRYTTKGWEEKLEMDKDYDRRKEIICANRRFTR